MKKIIPFLIVGILVLSGLGAVAGTEKSEKNIISENIIFSEPSYFDDENYVSLELSEATVESWEEGMPALPVVTKTYTFPIGTKIDDVKVTFSEISEKVLSKPIKPSPEIYILENALSKNNKGSEEILTYSDISIYPEQRYGYRTGCGLKGKEHVIYLTVTVYPDQYFPQQNIIAHAEKATIDIEFTPPENPITFGDTYDLLIIAPANFESALQPLVDHKNNLDPPVRTNLVTLDEIPSGVGVDTQEDIKYFIKDAIEDWGITYLILVGAGVEGEELFPVRQAWVESSGHEDYFPSDLYYADIYDSEMNFSDWDADGDGRFAEFPTDMSEVDVIPDLYLGKWPANDASEVTILVNKIIDYKAHNKMTNKLMQIGGDSFTDDDIYEGEYANTIVLSKLPGYTPYRAWASHPNPDYDTNPLTKVGVKNGFMQGIDFVDLCGHGSWASFATHPPHDDSIWIPPATLISTHAGFLYYDFDLYMVKNAKKYPVCIYKSCSNNKYSMSPDSFGWRTLTKEGGGGIATIAAAGISYGSTGTDIVNSCTGWMEVHTFEQFGIDDIKILGQLWGNDIADYFTTFETEFDLSDYKTMLEWSLFGDPTLVLEDGDNPQTINVNVPTYHPLLEKFVNVFPQIRNLLKQIFEKYLGFF